MNMTDVAAATIRDLHWPLLPDANPTVAAMLHDPYLAHIVAVELTGNGQEQPVRHWIDGTGLHVRNPATVQPVPALWGEALPPDPIEHVIELAPQGRYQVSLDVVPEQSEPHHRSQGRGRGRRRYIAAPAEQAVWLTDRFTTAGCTDITVRRLEQRLASSTHTVHDIRSVHAVLDVTVTDPEAAAALEVGRRRSYGYGTPRWAHA